MKGVELVVCDRRERGGRMGPGKNKRYCIP